VGCPCPVSDCGAARWSGLFGAVMGPACETAAPQPKHPTAWIVDNTNLTQTTAVTTTGTAGQPLARSLLPPLNDVVAGRYGLVKREP